MGTFANNEDPDEMQHIAAFHQGLHCSMTEKILPETPKSTQWAVPYYLLYQYVWGIPSEYKGLRQSV